MTKARTFDDLTRQEAEAHCEAYAASLGPRLEWFVEHVAATGGPSAAELDASPESLDLLGNWVLQQQPDIGASREGRELPLWADLEPGAWTWGPRLLLLADGLVAYRAHCYRRRWPDTEWRVHDGRKSDVDYRQPMLWIDRGRGRVNLPLITINSVANMVINGTKRDPTNLRRVWEIWAPKN